MPGLIKYSTSSVDGALRKGNTVVGMGEVPTNTAANMAPGMDIPSGGYVVYTIGLNNTPKMWVADSESELLPIARTLGGNPTTVEDAIYYICSVTDAWILDNPINDIVDDGLIMNLHASNLSSYPGINTSFMDISGNGNNTNVNSAEYNSGGGYFQSVGNAPDSLIFSTPDSTTISETFTVTDGGWTIEELIRIDDTTYPEAAAGTVVSERAYGSTNTGFDWNHGVMSGTSLNIDMSNKDTGGGASRDAEVNLLIDSDLQSYGKWILRSIYWDRTNDKCGVYYNGRFQDSGSISGVSGFPLYDGGGISWGTLYGWHHEGARSFMRVYNRVLKESEVLQNFHQGSIVTDGLIFAADAGNLVSYQSGSANAYSLTGSLEGDVVNAPTFNSNNKGFWEFDGTDDKINFPSTQILSDLGVTGGNDNDVAYSIEAWVRINNYPPGVGISGDSIIGFNDEHGIGLQIFGDGSSAWFNFGYRSNNNYDSSDISLNTWYHVVATRDIGGSQGNYKIYINNIKDKDSNGDLRVDYTTVDMGIGNSSNRIGPFNGDIALTRIYNKVLTQAEVTQNWNSQRSRFSS